MDVMTDRVVRKLDPVGVEEFALDLGNRPMSREPSMSDPAKNVPGDRPMRWGDARLDFGALCLGVSGTTGIGAMVELADQFHRAFERMNMPIPMIAYIHSPSTHRTVALKDVEFTLRVIRISGPCVRHRADVHALVRS